MIKLTNILKDILILEVSPKGNTQQIIGWHLSHKKIKSFTNEPIWFFTRKELAGLSAFGKREKDMHLYETKITGNFLSKKDFYKLCKKLGLDKDEVEGDLTSSPTKPEKLQIIKPFKPYCDGFWHWDYDPRDNQGNGVESLLVFDPTKTAQIIREVPYGEKIKEILSRLYRK